MISADRLGRNFGGRPVVSDVSFTVDDGEVVGLVGPNGAGKTTTIRMLLGLLRQSSGRATVDKPCGYLPEQFTGYDALSVTSYLRFCARMKSCPPSSVSDTVAETMERTDLVDLAHRPIGRLSKGQRQRVGLAQAVLGTPKSLVLDEPTIGLDPQQVVDARAMVQAAANDGCAVLVSTHLLAEAAVICDRVLVVVAGELVAEEVDLDVADLEAKVLGHMARTELR